MSGLLLGTSGTLEAHPRHPQLAPEDIEKGERVLVCTCMQMLLPKKSSVAASPQSSNLFFGRDLHIKKKRTELGYLQDTFLCSLNGKSSPYSYNLYFLLVCFVLGVCGYKFFMLCSKSHNVALFYSGLLRYWILRRNSF